MCRGVWLVLLSVTALARAQDAATLFHEGVAAQQRGDFKLAIERYQQLVKQHPESVEVRANLGAALAHEGRLDEAIVQYQKALERAPDSPQLRLNLALAFYKKNDFARAAEPLSRLHEAQPDDARVATLLGDCYLRLGRFSEAVNVLRPSAQAHPDDLGVKWVLGTALIRNGDPRAGLEQVEQVAREGKNPEAYRLAAETWLNLNEFERGAAVVKEGIALAPDYPGLYTLSGRLKQYLGDYAGALHDLEKALERNPDDFDAQLNEAAILNAQRNLDGARKHIERALAIQPDSPVAWFELARIERSTGDIAASVRDFEKVVRAEPNWLRPHVELAALYYKVNRPADGEKERGIVDRLQKDGAMQPKGLPQASEHPPSQ